MKKFLFVMCAMLVSVGAFAQKGEKNVGAYVLYGTNMKNIGIGVKYLQNFTEAIRLEAVGDYYLKTDGFTMFDVNVNGHYLFPLSDKVTSYPLVGINFTSWKNSYDFEDYGLGDYYYGDYSGYDTDVKDSSIGLNFGGGIQYQLTDKLRIGAELKYQTISGFNTTVIGAGITYTL